MIVILIGILSPLLLGYCLLRLLAPDIGLAQQIFLGGGIGAGLVSCCFFVSLVAGPVPGLPSPALELSVLAVAGVLCVRQRLLYRPVRANLTPWTPAARFHAAIFVLTALAALLTFLSVLNAQPHGGWDGWAIWNMQARFLGTSAAHDNFPVFLFYAHSDYPLLVQGFIARIWRATGGQELIVPALTAAVFTFATVGVLVSSLTALKGRARGFLAGILLVNTHFFVVHGASEYADVPIGFYVLSTFVTFALAQRGLSGETGATRRWLPLLPGLAAGLAAWTKNEGWTLVAALAALSLFGLRNRQGRHTYGRFVGLTVAGLAPMLVILVYFKRVLATATDFESGRSLRSLTILVANPDRYRELGRGLLNAVDGSIGHSFLIPLLGMALYGFYVRHAASQGAGGNRASDRATTRVCVCALAIVFTGYCAALVVSPWEIGWQVGTTLDRLLVQLLPAALFTACFGMRSFE